MSCWGGGGACCHVVAASIFSLRHGPLTAVRMACTLFQALMRLLIELQYGVDTSAKEEATQVAS